MPYQVQQIIEGKGTPVCVTKDEPVSKALSLMIEHDFSQLPVISKQTNLANVEIDAPEGMITYEGILRGVRNFKARIEDLKVRDVMVSAPVYSADDDLFDILDLMKDTNAVLVTEDIYGLGSALVGIVTSYDTAEYFRKRTEDLMRVEDIELMIKEFIKSAYMDENGELNLSSLNAVAGRITAYVNKNGEVQKEKTFDELTLSEYITFLLLQETWLFFEPIFGVKRNFINELLNGVREIRNALAHFRGDISAEQRDKLKFGAEWLTRKQDEYQRFKEQQEKEKLIEIAREYQKQSQKALVERVDDNVQVSDSIYAVSSSTDFLVTEAATGGGRYAALADWLQSQPGRVDTVQLTFNQIEEIIKTDLPASARNHRAWWANDSVGHSHSQLWLEAGWRTAYINLTEGKITFSRIRDREKAYITFFSKLLDEFRKKADFSIREASPDGASWIVIQSIPRSGASFGSFTFSFSRDKRLRIELYLDLGDKTQTKDVFDKLFEQRERFATELGEIEWERLDNRRASRLALYRGGHIAEPKEHAELRKWAAETMVKFYNTLVEPAEKAIREVKNG